MDKKNTAIGVVFILGAFFCIWFSAKNSRRQAPPAEVQRAVAKADASDAPRSPGVDNAPSAPAALGNQPAFAPANPERAGATVTTLENDFISAHFTDFGGAIRDVELKKYPAKLHSPDPFVLNQLHADPMLAFVGFPGLDRTAHYQLVSQTATEVVYRATLAGRLEVTRRYILSPSQVGATDPYQIRSETTFRNLTGEDAVPFPVALAVGTAAPTDLLDRGDKLASGYSTGKDQEFLTRSALEPSGGIFGLNPREAKPFIDSPGPIVWGAVKNQFFSIILTPDKPGTDLIVRRVKLFGALPDTLPNAYGIASSIPFTVPALAPHASVTLGAELYAGPNEYHRLSNIDVFKADEDKVMQFGIARFFSEILLTLMTAVHTKVPNWGLSIVITTLLLRLVMMFLTIPASRSARRMQKIQPEIKAMREKYKDNPQKQQQATMELFKKHKVNPVGGCLPQLLTLPFWYGFFAMLRSAAELRFAPFLWAHDLSAPDTVFSFGHGTLPIVGTLDLNIFPLILCAVSFLQMSAVPQATVDNSQAKMMKFMPIFMTVIYYSYSCALSVYSITNGIFMIGQQALVNRMKDDGDPTHETAAQSKAAGKAIKNVTPKKK